MTKPIKWHLRSAKIHWVQKQRLWSDWAKAQADLSLRWTHNQFVDFVIIGGSFYLKGNVYAFREGNSVKTDLLSFWKGICYKRKEFALPGSKFFPVVVDPFLCGSKQDVRKIVFLVIIVEKLPSVCIQIKAVHIFLMRAIVSFGCCITFRLLNSRPT